MAEVSPRQLQLHIHSIDSFNEYDQRTENYIYMWFKVKFLYFLQIWAVVWLEYVSMGF